MADSSGINPIGPQDQRAYEIEYKHGADLFQRALDQYSKSDNPYQKAEFKDVMDQAMNVLNETAKELMRSELQKQNEKISEDYNTFQKFPGNPDAQEKLANDLDRAKKSIG